MKKLFLLAALLCVLGIPGLAQSQCVRINEVDGTPNVNCVRQIIVTNGTLSCSGNVCTLVTGGGGGGSAIVVGTTSITGGTTTRILYNNAGTVGEYAISGTGNVAMTTSPTFTTPALGTPSAIVLTNGTGLPPTTGISGWPANASGCLSNNGSGTLSWAACSGGGGSQTPWTSNIDAAGFNLRVTDSTGIQSNETSNPNILLFTSVASAVNYATLTNAPTGTGTTGAVILSTAGSDTRVPLYLNPKGTTYPNGKQIIIPTNSRFDDPVFVPSDFPTAGVGIGFKSGGSVFDITMAKLAFNGNELELQGSAVLSFGTTGTAWSSGINTPDDDPPGRNTGIGKAAKGVLEFAAYDGDPSDNFVGGTWRARANTPSQITANQNNYNPGGPSYTQRLSTDASRDLTGLTFTDPQVNGQVHRIWNVGSNALVLKHQSVSSTAANRFLNSTGSDISLAANECADLQYDSTDSRWRVTPCATSGAGSGTVTSVAQSFTGGLISVSGSPVTTSGTLALTVAGTSGGIPYFSSASTWASSAALTANAPVIGGGAGVAPTVGTVSGNTTKFVTTTGTLTSGRCAEWDASGNLIQSSGACGGSGGSPGGSSGDVQINNAGSFGAANLNYSAPTLTQTTTSLGSTRTDGLVLQNTTAASAGTTQYSQSLRFSAHGWRTTTTAGDRTVEVNLDLRPIEQTTNPAYGLQISTQCASCTTGTTWSQHSRFDVALDGTKYAWFPGGTETGWPGVAFGTNFGTQASPVIDGIYSTAGGSYLILRPANRVAMHGSGLSLLSGATFAFNDNASSITTGTNDTFLSRGGAAATLQQGAANAASPVAQTLRAQGSRSGTDTNVAGANYTIQSGTGTGNSIPSTLILRSPVAVASGTTAQTMATGLTINNGTAVLTSYTVANLPSASATGMTGAMAFVTDATSTTAYTTVAGGGSNKVLVISDGTNWIIH